MNDHKRGISPIIATLLLISLALILAVIIFLWAKSFVGEKLQKFGQPIEYICEKIDFDVDTTLRNADVVIDVVNHGNVPLYGLDIKKRSGLSSLKRIRQQSFDKSIVSGDTGSISLSVSLHQGDTLVIVPLILGEIAQNQKAYPCDKQGIEKVVV